MVPPEGNFDEETDFYGNFVPAVMARSLDEAEFYCKILGDRDIPAIVRELHPTEQIDGGAPPTRGMTRGVHVLVPEALLDETGLIIAALGEFDHSGVDQDIGPDLDDQPDGLNDQDASDEDDESLPDQDDSF